METILLIILIIIVLIAIGLFWSMSRAKSGSGQGVSEANTMLLTQLNELNRIVDSKIGDLTKTVDHKMSQSTRDMNDAVRSQFDQSQKQFGESQKLVDKFLREVTQMTDKVARVEETGKQMVGFADQLQSLQDILKNPKQRGILGEYYLETVLKNVLPPGSYQMQYPFKDGTIVDAVVFVKEKIIPIDSKFSLENYNRLVSVTDPAERDRLEKAFKADLKNRIDETAKYVQPSQNTMDFAFMFIPHEAIYYDLLVAQVGATKINTRDLIEYAFKEKHVIIVSPTSFLAYLQTVLQGLKALHIEEQAKDIRKHVENLGKHLLAYEQYFDSLGKNLNTTVSQYNKAGKEFQKIDKDILRITGESAGLLEDPLVLASPDLDKE